MQFAFSIQTARTTGVGRLASLKPDKDGYYCGVPMTVIGEPSRNKMVYEPNSLISAMTAPKSKFYQALIAGGLEGEYGHPDLSQIADKGQILRRLSIVLPTQVSHTFRKVWCDRTRDGKHWIVLADLKPVGPFGKFLQEAFEDENRDTCFSLRSLTTTPVMKDGVGYKSVAAATTYDYEPVPGYEMASKRYTIGNESFDCTLSDDDVFFVSSNELDTSKECLECAGLESFDSQELLDRFQTDLITTRIVNTRFGMFDTETGLLTGDFGPRSLVSAVFGGGGKKHVG